MQVLGPYSGRVGYNGVVSAAYKREGDGRTPTGAVLAGATASAPWPTPAWRAPGPWWARTTSGSTSQPVGLLQHHAARPGERPLGQRREAAQPAGRRLRPGRSRYNDARTPYRGSAIIPARGHRRADGRLRGGVEVGPGHAAALGRHVQHRSSSADARPGPLVSGRVGGGVLAAVEGPPGGLRRGPRRSAAAPVPSGRRGARSAVPCRASAGPRRTASSPAAIASTPATTASTGQAGARSPSRRRCAAGDPGGPRPRRRGRRSGHAAPTRPARRRRRPSAARRRPGRRRGRRAGPPPAASSTSAGRRDQRRGLGPGEHPGHRGQRRRPVDRHPGPALPARDERQPAGEHGAQHRGGQLTARAHRLDRSLPRGGSSFRYEARTQSAHRISRSPSAVAIADSTARALCRVSASSVAASLSATIPAPACT